MIDPHALRTLIEQWRDFSTKPIGVNCAAGYDGITATLSKCADDLEAVLSALPETPWQPMETAPERRKVLVTWVNGLGKRRTTFASFWPVGTMAMGDECSEDDVDDEGRNTQAGWWEESEANDEDCWRITEALTHWMPLPASPSSPEETK